jgi:hypothetical protein
MKCKRSQGGCPHCGGIRRIVLLLTLPCNPTHAATIYCRMAGQLACLGRPPFNDSAHQGETCPCSLLSSVGSMRCIFCDTRVPIPQVSIPTTDPLQNNLSQGISIDCTYFACMTGLQTCVVAGQVLLEAWIDGCWFQPRRHAHAWRMYITLGVAPKGFDPLCFDKSQT